MAFINGINELANTLLIIISPIILMVFSGYTIGRVISKVRKVNPALFRDLIYGNIMLNFLFVSGFIFFGVLTSWSKGIFQRLYIYTHNPISYWNLSYAKIHYIQKDKIIYFL